MTANAKDTILAVAGQAGGVTSAIEGEVKVGVGLITRWYAVPHLCEGSLQQTKKCIRLWIATLPLYRPQYFTCCSAVFLGMMPRVHVHVSQRPNTISKCAS